MQSAGELLVVGFEGTRAPEELLARVRAGRVGGVILFARNIARADDGVMVSAVEVAQLVGEIAAAAPAGLPLIVSVDQEGGRVQRLKAPLAVWGNDRVLGDWARGMFDNVERSLADNFYGR